MPAETIGGVVFPEWDASKWAKEMAETDWEKVRAFLKPNIDRLKLIGALEPEFEI